MRKEKVLQFVPMVLVELYLVLTLLLLRFGPITYHLGNTAKFWTFIVFYHVAFILGYILVSLKKKEINASKVYLSDSQIQKLYWIMLAIGFLVWIVVYRNGTHARSYIPYELPQNFIKGLLHPADRYYWKLSEEAYNQFHGNQPITLLASVFYPFYYCMPAIMIYLWDKIKRSQKIISYIQVFLSLAMGISVGTNKYIFDILFILIGGFIIEIVSRFNEEGFSFIKKRKIVLFTIVFLCIFDIFYFTYNLRDRVGNMSAYVARGNEDIIIEDSFREEIDYEEVNGEGFLTSMLVGVESYVCQGYYGFSLALDQDFTSTYGIGHSMFLLVTFDNAVGTDLTARTYQEKITSKWSRTGRWHSFYSQMANDVGFYGVVVIMFLLGVILAQVWKDACHENNIIAKSLIILLVILFLYIPANNQLGNSSGTFFAFWELLFIWICEHIPFVKEKLNQKLR